MTTTQETACQPPRAATTKAVFGVNSATAISGISTIYQDQAAIFSALKTNKPSSTPQLSLL
jgi:hypothetical protein